jgi:hypothetical protein
VILATELRSPIVEPSVREFFVLAGTSAEPGQIPARGIGMPNHNRAHTLAGPKIQGLCWAEKAVLVGASTGRITGF